MTTTPTADDDRHGKVESLTKKELERFGERTPRSSEYYERAKKVMPGGVPSSFQTNDPGRSTSSAAREPTSGTSTATSTSTSTTASA